MGCSPYMLQHGECLAGSTDPSVDLLVTVAGWCHLGAKIAEFFSVF